jgi:hypothetical protein
MTTIKDIEAAAKAVAEQRDRVAACVDTIEQARAALLRDELPKLRRHMAKLAEQEQALRDKVAEAPHLFTKPRTLVLHGLKVGFEKGKGKIVFDDADAVVALIDKKLPELAEVLVITDRKPNRKAMAQLTVQQLRSLGVTVEEAGDAVVVRAVNSDIDKLVLALLKGFAADIAEATAG